MESNEYLSSECNTTFGKEETEETPPIEQRESCKIENSKDTIPNDNHVQNRTQEANIVNEIEEDDEENENDWLDITGSGDFKKRIIKKGLGPETRPNQGDEVTVNVKYSIGEKNIVQNENFKFIVGDLDVIQGLELAICLMEKGEIAQIKIPSKLAYGAKGCLPDFPANVDVECTVELLNIANVDVSDISIEERLQLGDKKRRRGNFFHERGDYIEAIHCYERAIEYLNSIRDSSGIENDKSQEIIDIKVKVYNNMAASHLKLSAYNAAFKSVEMVLSIQPQNVKALFRKAKILSERGELTDALSCLRLAAKLEPETKVIQAELSRLMLQQRREEQKQKAMYQRMFPKSTPKKPSLLSKLAKWGVFVSGASALAVAVGVATYKLYLR